jgi:hypothetical protein
MGEGDEVDSSTLPTRRGVFERCPGRSIPLRSMLLPGSQIVALWITTYEKAKNPSPLRTDRHDNITARCQERIFAEVPFGYFV